MLRFATTNLFLLILAVKLASEGAHAAPLPRWSMPKFGGSSKSTGTPPPTTNAAGEPISFMDAESLLDAPIKTTSDTVSKVAKGATIAGGGAAVVGGGVGAGVAASQNAGLAYDYAG